MVFECKRSFLHIRVSFSRWPCCVLSQTDRFAGAGDAATVRTVPMPASTIVNLLRAPAAIDVEKLHKSHFKYCGPELQPHVPSGRHVPSTRLLTPAPKR